MIDGNNQYWQNAAMNIRKDGDEWRLAKDTVSNTYTPEDEGKVVSDGELISQTSGSTTSNGTVDTTTINSLEVNVANSYSQADNGKVVNNQELVAQIAYPTEITENDTYDTTNYNSITVNVSGGGGGAGGTDVIFYDYDGTIVQTYSAADFVNLSAMPANPTHTGLTAQGWNWSLADAKTYVATYGKLNIGQMYITSDGKTRLYYVIPKDNLTLDLYLTLDEDTELDVDWGDNSEHTTWTSNDGDSSKSHEYSDGGSYTVAITVTAGGFSLSTNYSEDISSFLKKIEIGNNMTAIGEYACLYCCGLTSVTIPNSVTSIGDNAFNSCYGLSSITIPSSVTSIGVDIFHECCSLSSITIPNSVTSIGDNAFYYCTSLSSITIPDSVTSIDNDTFQYCTSLSSITIPSSVTSIEYEAFGYCYALTSITIPNSVESIGNNAFSYCHALSSIIIPNSVISIEYNAFNECFALTSITIPSSTTSIGNNAFYYCYALSSITFEPTTPPELYGDLSIPYTCIIRVPQGTLSDYTSASNYPDPSSYIYEEY